MSIPILILSDAPDSGTGLGRITKDLAYILSTMPEFRVATLGRGGLGSRHLPWAQYVFPESEQWGEGLLIKACEDFSKDEPFIIFTIWDASRLFWFAQPNALPEGHPLRSFLTSGKFERWGYFPVDAYGINKSLSVLSRNTLSGFGRILAYSKFGVSIIANSTRDWATDFIPHIIHSDIFYDLGKEEGRTTLGLESHHKLVGCVMTNQARKDWGVWAQTARLLIDKNPNYRFWANVDFLENYWSLPALIEDFGLGDYVRITQAVTDETLAKLYSACDVTFLPSLGEGFGYPLAESMACGVPAIHTSYGAGTEIVGRENSVDSHTFRLDTLHNVYRPVLDPHMFTQAVDYRVNHLPPREEVTDSISHLFWYNLAPVWKHWFKKGLSNVR